MIDDVVRGSGNVFRDLGLPDPDLEQARALLASEIIAILDARRLSDDEAARLAGVPRRDIVRVRAARLTHLTLDRLVAILGRLDDDVRVSVALDRPNRLVA